MYLVIVESPSKARVIGKYLGKDYTVLSTQGHVRIIPPTVGAIDVQNNFRIRYELNQKTLQHVKKIKEKARRVDVIYIATDPDREGEAIGWHIVEILKESKACSEGTLIQRIVFNEVTRAAILRAIQAPRDIDLNLVRAQQTRSALDHLIGFNISPVLWYKVPGSRSAGRVQSPGLRMICDRENEINHFVSQEYWTVDVEFLSEKKDIFLAQLIQIGEQKIQKFDLASEEQVSQIVSALEKCLYSVEDISTQNVSRHPPPPLITSTLQQEAAKQFGYAPKQTMRVAQKLYEGVRISSEHIGLITYMRTDGTSIAGAAVKEIQALIKAEYGAQYLFTKGRSYKSKVKNAQEAHEAIRPTSVLRKPEDLKSSLTDPEYKIYRLIWNRAVATQMEAAKYEKMTVIIQSQDQKYILRSSVMRLLFDGWSRVLGRDTTHQNEKADLLDGLRLHEKPTLQKILPKQHFTEPPPRYSHASFIKEMESQGIGRPSTYEKIGSVLLDRQYVTLVNKQFVPSIRGRVVIAFLKNYFKHYVAYEFTANMEDKLDKISNGLLDSVGVSSVFWEELSGAVQSVKAKTVAEITETMKRNDLDYLIDKDFNFTEKCPKCGSENFNLRIGRYGAMLCCDQYPDCQYTQFLGRSSQDDGQEYPKLITHDPKTGLPVTLRNGPFGLYLQVGEAEGKKKPKRIVLPKQLFSKEIQEREALFLIALPKEIGLYPGTDVMMKLGIGRYGPYVQYADKYVSINQKYDFFSLTQEETMAILSRSRKLKGVLPTPMASDG